MTLSSPLGTTRCVPQEKGVYFPQSFIYCPCLVGQDGWIMASFFFACLWTETELRTINTQKKENFAKNFANIQPS